MQIHHQVTALALLALLTRFAAADASTNWPEFRGADARGIPSSSKLPDHWSATENVAWKTDIAGRGWSSPIIWGDNVFLTTVVSQGDTEAPKKGLYFGGERAKPSDAVHDWKVLCLDLNTGAVRWDTTVHTGVPATPIHIKNSYASETPTTDGTHVFAAFGNVGLFALDFDGKITWSLPLAPVTTRFGWGPAASPVLHGDRLFYVSDNEDQGYLLALDKATGKELFRIPRDEKSNWSTPFVWEHDGTAELITTSSHSNCSYDLDGKERWTLSGMSSITIARPYAADGLLYLSSGYVGDKRKPLYAIRPGASGDISLAPDTATNEFIAWSRPDIAPYNPSTLVHDGRLYVLYDRGMLSCFDAKTGEVKYEREKIDGSGGFTVSPWAVGDKIFCLDEDGKAFVLRAGDTFALLHTNTLADDDMCMATPAFSGDRLLLRTAARIYAIQQK